MRKGIILLLLAEISFSAATVFTKIVTNNSEISSIEVAFFRFFLGIFLAFYPIYKQKMSIKPKNIKLVFWRGVLNTVAVIFFYLAIEYSTVTNANMLNMTYPVFIFLVAPWLTGEKSNKIFLWFLAVSMIGVYLVIHPDFKHIRLGDIFGLVSGIIASFGVTTLRMARKYDNTSLIVFWLMVTGTIITFFAMLPNYVHPQGFTWIPLIVSAILGIAGQFFITLGYKYISAEAGGLVSTSRILFAGILGVSIFSDSLSVQIVVGGMLILISLIGLYLYAMKKNTAK